MSQIFSLLRTLSSLLLPFSSLLRTLSCLLLPFSSLLRTPSSLLRTLSSLLLLSPLYSLNSSRYAQLPPLYYFLSPLYSLIHLSTLSLSLSSLLSFSPHSVPITLPFSSPVLFLIALSFPDATAAAAIRTSSELLIHR